MAKRNFAALALVSVLGLAASPARAEAIPVAVDGCAELARVIYSEVSAAALYGPGRSGPWLINQQRGDLSVCGHAAKTVSRAFTSAMLSAGQQVFWRSDGGFNPGDYCLSAFLSQCYPNGSPYASVGLVADHSVVMKTWAVTSQLVMREMYNPFSSDEVRFRSDDLKLRLGLSLRSIDAVDHRLDGMRKWKAIR